MSRCVMVWMSLFTNNVARRSTDHLLALMPKAKREQDSPKSRDMLGYVTYVARKSLLSFTTSLTKVSSQAHDFFAHINSYLAFERMMRNCFGWMMPSTSVLSMAATPNWFAFMPQTLSKPVPQTVLPMNDSLPIYGTMMALSAAMMSLAPTAMQAWGISV